MRNIVRVILFTSVISVAASSPCAKGWRGIVPLHSMRADVERLIGKPNYKYDLYDFENERAYIMYSDAPCSAGGYWNVPQDTVISIDVVPKARLKLSDLGINLNEYEEIKAPLAPIIYHNGREGITYAVDEVRGEDGELIREITYGPATGDQSLKCPNLPPPLPCIRPPHHCPILSISGQTEPCVGSVHKVAATITGGDREDTFTFNWTVSAGEMTSGQGTSSITVDSSAAGDKPITVTVKVVPSLCEACLMEESYTIKPCPKRRVIKGGGRRWRTPSKP